jgi:uncharacterized protein YuzE
MTGKITGVEGWDEGNHLHPRKKLIIFYIAVIWRGRCPQKREQWK